MPMSVEEVQDLLMKAAIAQAVAQGYRLGEGADSDLRQSASTAAREIFFNPDALERARAIEQAVRAFQTMVDTMIRMRREAYANDLERLRDNLIGEQTLHLARLQLCPGFFPFC